MNLQLILEKAFGPGTKVLPTARHRNNIITLDEMQ
jgi:hypothetical protein